MTEQMREYPLLVVGAGVAGLAIGRQLKAHQLPFEIVDRHSQIGGLWNWQIPDNGMYRSAHFISSKQRTAFPGFPMPASYPDFPSTEQVGNYLREFARHYDLNRHMTLGVAVDALTPAAAGGWDARFNNGETRRYQRVILATGHMWDPVWPDIPGHFDGQMRHAVSYKTSDIFANKRVVIVGLGNSACDIAVDALHGGATSVTISARSGSWIVPKYLLGKPADATGGKLTGWLPAPLRQRINQVALRLLAPRPESFGLPAPEHAFHQALPVVNSQLLYYIGHGRISPRPEITRFDGSQVVFADGSHETADIVLFATGYNISFPFIAAQHLNWQGNHPDFYLHVFHPQRDDLFLIGIHEQISGGWSMHDTQAAGIARYIRALALPQGTAAARRLLPRLHQQVRTVTQKSFIERGSKYGVLVDETAYKKAFATLNGRLPQPHIERVNTAEPAGGTSPALHPPVRSS